MSSNTKTETTFWCDRPGCDEKFVLKKGEDTTQIWSQINSSTRGKKAINADLCSKCSASFLEWFEKLSSDKGRTHAKL